MEKGENAKLSTGPNAEKRKRKGTEKVQCATTEASIAADQPQRASQPAKQPAAAQKLHGRGRGGGSVQFCRGSSRQNPAAPVQLPYIL